jgi:hypothetical protein
LTPKDKVEREKEGKGTLREAKSVEPRTTEEDSQKEVDKIRRGIKLLIDDPVLFCMKLLRFEPFAYQVKFLEDKSDRIIACAARQVGKSTVTAAIALWLGSLHPNKTILIASPSLGQSMLMFDKIQEFVQNSEILEGSVSRRTRTLIRFMNGSVIRALPCGPHGKMLRGNSADLVILDEAAYVPERIIMEVIMPMLAAKHGKIILISSPCDKKHFFYRAFNSEYWSKHHFSAEECPLISKEFLEEQREEIGETMFRREYLAEFAEDEGTYFPMELLRRGVHLCNGNQCSYCDVINFKSAPQGDLYAGYDPGGLSDPAALVVVQRAVVEEEVSQFEVKKEDTNNPEGRSDTTRRKRIVFRVVLSNQFLLSKEEKKTSQAIDVYTRFTSRVSEIHRRLKFNRILVDSTGVGAPILFLCKDLNMPADGVVLSQNTKKELLSNLRILIEQGRVEFPNDRDLLSHLNAVTFELDRTGSYIFGHEAGAHDDLAFALALAVWAARSGSSVWMLKKEDKDEDSKNSEGRQWRERERGI